MKNIDGFLNIQKPDGITSAQVVRDIKRVITTKKIGYIGTLDPIAEGVLVIALGRATRLIQFLEKVDKIYDTSLTLGVETDTQDRTGKIMNEADPSLITEEMFKNAALKYVGEIEQIPPMFSAKKIDGKRLYDLARQGISVERKPVKVSVHELEFIEKNGPSIRFRARVSTGAYMRTLCHDIGADLGVYGHLSSLTRLKSGSFDIEDSLPLSKVTTENMDEVEKNLISLSGGLMNMSEAVVIAHAVEKLKNGMSLGVSDIFKYENKNGANYVKIVGKDGALFGVGVAEGVPMAGFPFGSIQPKRVLV